MCAFVVTSARCGNSTADPPPLSPLAMTGACGPLSPEQLHRPYMVPFTYMA